MCIDTEKLLSVLIKNLLKRVMHRSSFLYIQLRLPTNSAVRYIGNYKFLSTTKFLRKIRMEDTHNRQLHMHFYLPCHHNTWDSNPCSNTPLNYPLGEKAFQSFKAPEKNFYSPVNPPTENISSFRASGPGCHSCLYFENKRSLCHRPER